MRVVLPSQLHGYSQGRSEVEGHGATLHELFDDLERRHPGLRFRVIDEQERVRRHILIFVGDARTEDLHAPLSSQATVTIVGALSGG